MDKRLRFAPLGAIVLLFVLKAWFPSFLRMPLVDGFLITWYQVVVSVLVPIAVYMFAPQLMRGLGVVVRKKLLLPVLVVIAAVGVVALGEGAYNQYNDPCQICPDSHLLNALLSFLFGA